MATRPKAVIESRNGEKFSPITIAKNVLTDDGQNLQDILSDRKEDMMTPTIENSSLMFKVGQGDDVDYSANVVNGAYEDVVLKGKSLVNVIQGSSKDKVVLPYSFEEGEMVTINDTHENGRVEVEVKGRTLVNLAKVRSVDAYNKCLDRNIPIKPNTKYIGIFKATYCQETGGNYACFMTSTVSVGDDPNYNGDHIYSISCPDGLGTEHKLNKGDQQFTFTSKSNEQYLHIRTGGGKGFTYEDMIVLEYQEGMENWDIPYFEGMQSVKMPILHSVGKNLFDKNTVNLNCALNGDGTLRNLLYGENNNVSDYIPVKGNTKYTKTNGDLYCEYDINKNFIKRTGGTMFTTSDDCKFIRMNIGDINNYQLEEGSAATPYEPHKSSILSLPEEVVLRSLPNGVCDTFNTRTGVYTQRIKEKVLNGGNSESWVKSGSFTGTSCIRFQLSLSDAYVSENTIISITNDKFPNYPNSSWQEDVEQVNIDISNRMSLNILKTKLTSEDVSGLRAWLSQNPTTICYELETPIVTKINLSSTLKSWNTTTHIYSEIPENTLYPILSHSTPTYPAILKPSTKYSIVANSYSNDHTNSAISFNLGGATASTTVGNRVTTITTPSTLSNELLTMSGRGNKLSHVMVVEGDVVGDEPYFEGICDCKSPILTNLDANNEQSNTVTFDQKDGKTIVLRSLPNGVCDTLNVRTGEYAQNIGEIICDGSEDERWAYNIAGSGQGKKCFNLPSELTPHRKRFGYIICDCMPTTNTLDKIGVYNGEGLNILIDSDSNDVGVLKEILANKPITVQYELATPIVKQVNVEGYPYAYENGHILLESGSQEQSLTPTIEYSIVANRNGQIRSNQKMVERQQKQLDRLQAMVLVNLVNTQYEQTLTNLKYVLKNVREEVK